MSSSKVFQTILLVGATFLLQACTSAPSPKPLAPIAAVTDADIRHEYDRLYAAADKKQQYRVRHILSISRDGAQRAIDRLKSGEDFSSVAQQVSSDMRSRQAGGELGWSWPDYYENEFSDVMVSLSPRGLATVPVKTSAGWHVIEVTETRYVTPFPEYEEVRYIISERLRKRAESK